MTDVISFIQANWELIVAVVSLILSWVAVLKSQDAIRSSDRQFLFDKRLEVYMLLRDLVSGYEQAKAILPIGRDYGAADLIYGWLCNVESLESIQGEVKEWDADGSQCRFMMKIDSLRKASVKIMLLYPAFDVSKASAFIRVYADVLVGLRGCHIVAEKYLNNLSKMSEAIRHMASRDELDKIYEMFAVGEHGLDKSVVALHELAKTFDAEYFRKLDKLTCLKERRYWFA